MSFIIDLEFPVALGQVTNDKAKPINFHALTNKGSEIHNIEKYLISCLLQLCGLGEIVLMLLEKESNLLRPVAEALKDNIDLSVNKPLFDLGSKLNGNFLSLSSLFTSSKDMMSH